MDLKSGLNLANKIRFFFMRASYGVRLINNKFTEKKEDSLVMKAIRYIANSPLTSFLNSRNLDYILNITAAATIFGTTAIFGFSVSAYSMGLIPSAMIVGSIAASVVMNGNELYKHKKMLKLHSVLSDMLDKVEKNNQLSHGLSKEQQNVLKAVLPDGIKSLKEHQNPQKRKELTAFGVAAFRGVFSSTTLVAIAASMVSMNPWAIGMTTAGWVTSMIGITDSEKRLYNMRMDFKEHADAAKQKLGCHTIASAISEYKRISAEAALLKAIKEGHSVDESRDIYNQVLEKTVPPIRKERRSESIKERTNCSITMLKNGFSSVQTAKLYEIPENKISSIKIENKKPVEESNHTKALHKRKYSDAFKEKTNTTEDYRKAYMNKLKRNTELSI